jgi:hypothetical protein
MNTSYLSSVKNTVLSSKPSTTIRMLLMVLFVSISPLISFGQCSYPAGATSVGTYTFCIDNINTITTANVNAGQYALVNVVKGFTYTFAVSDVWSATGNANRENLTLFDASNDLDFGLLGYNRGQSGVSITWIATISGQIKVLLSKNCNTTTSGGTITITLNSIGNTLDSQIAYGTNTWTGHIYNSVGASPEPFVLGNYAGFYNVNTETISEAFGGDYVCFPVLSNGTQRASIYTEQFAVRYRMKSTRAAGYYFMNANADDGIRVTVDGVTVLNSWSDHSNTQYCNNLIYLNGSSDIILDYYENAGGNVVGFNLAPVTGNTISSYADRNVCSGVSPGNLDGSNVLTCINNLTTYQWQSSTDNVNFTNISDATTEDYTPTTVSTTSVDIKYYRRVLKAFGVPITASNPATGSVKVTTNPPTPVTPAAITGSTAQCAGNTLQTYSIVAVANATIYNWTLPTNWTITAGSGTNSITVSIASNGTTGNVSVNAANGCGTSASVSQWVVVSNPTVAGTVTPANTNVCSGINSTNLSLSGQTGSILRWESSSDNFAGGTITTIASTGSPITASNVAVDTYYRAVVQNGGCNVLNTNSVKISVVGAMVSPGLISINGGAGIVSPTTNCASTTMTFSIAPVANATSYTWVVGTGWTIVSGQGTTSVLVTTGTTAQSNNISVYATNGTCPQTSSTYLYVTLTNTATPTATAAQTFCSGATVANLSATGTAIKWYLASSGGSPLATTTALVNGTHYYASQTVGSCESTTRFDVTATVTATPSAPTVGTTTQPTCSTATGSVVLNSLPTGPWILTRSPGSVTTTGTGTSTTISGLPSGAYTYSVNSLNNGLKGEYFNNKTLTGSPVLTRTDATVSFNWAGSSPDPSVNADIFSVRWSGFVQPTYSQTYTFSTSSDDGIRLWVNGVQVINNWSDHSATTNTGTIALTAGVKYDIVLEYYENGGDAVSQLSWSSPTNPTSVIIPSTQLYSVASCGSPASANVGINAQPATPVAPTVGTITQPDCVTGGSVFLSNLPATGTISQTGTSTNSYTITATTMTISGLAAGSYNFTVSNGTCTSSATGNVVINAAVTNTWNGTAWSNGTPNSTQKIVFSGNYPPATPALDPDVDITGCSCKVTGSTAVIIKSGKTLTITNEVTVLGTLTFENSASLVQINDNAVNSGVIIYKRITAPIRKTDYTYWSSPVTPLAGGGTLLGSIITSQYYLSFDSVVKNDWIYVTASKQMTNGVGYAIQGPNTNAGSAYPASFTGVPNNGNVTVPVIFTNPLNLLPTNPNYGVSYLLGNPYPSAINANTFLTTNAGKLDGTLYFWTHFTEIGLGTVNLGSGALAYTSDDYASYNYTGGVSGTGYAAPTIGLSAIAKDIPNGKIAAGQGFFATSIASGNVIFNNSMRLAGTNLTNGTGTNQQFFKTKNASKTTTTIERHRVWLDLSNTQGAFKQTLIGYVTDATNEYDSRFDGESFDGNEFVDFYSVNQDKNLVIQGRALPFDENDTVPLGFRTTIEGAFTINIDQTDGLLTNQAVFIEDKLTNTVFDLKSGNYTFNTAAGTFDDRFVLRYNNKTLSVDEIDKEDGILVLYSNNYKTLIIHTNEMFSTVNSVALFNMTGQNIANWEVNDSEQTNIQIPIKNVSSGIYIVKVKTTRGESSKKIIIK